MCIYAVFNPLCSVILSDDIFRLNFLTNNLTEFYLDYCILPHYFTGGLSVWMWLSVVDSGSIAQDNQCYH